MKLNYLKIEKLEKQIAKLKHEESESLKLTILPFLQDATKCTVIGRIGPSGDKLDYHIYVNIKDDAEQKRIRKAIIGDSTIYLKCSYKISNDISLQIHIDDDLIMYFDQGADLDAGFKAILALGIPINFEESIEDANYRIDGYKRCLDAIEELQKL